MGTVNFEAGANAGIRELSRATIESQLQKTETIPLSLPTTPGRDGGLVAVMQKIGVYPYLENGHIRREILPDVHKIAVLRSNGIGDFIFSVPALNALRIAYPQAEIVLLGLDWHAEFLSGRPSPIDRVEVVPRSRGVRDREDYSDNPEELDQFFHRMAQESFDLAIQMHGGGRYSNPFVQRLGARFTAGMRTPDAVTLDRWMPYSYFQLEVLRYLELVSLVGAQVSDLEPQIVVTEEDLSEADRIVPATGQPLVVLHPGAGDLRRRWPVDKFAAVGNALSWAGSQVVVTGDDKDRELVDEVVTTMAARAQNLAGCLSLGGLAGLLSRAKVVISNDSGPLHLARAVGAPTVGIYWCGNLITAGPVTRARHRTAISWRLNCPICGLNCTLNPCEHRVSFVADVPQEEVTLAALELAGFSD